MCLHLWFWLRWLTPAGMSSVFRTFHFEAQLKILQQGEGAELSGGAVELAPGESPKAKGKRRLRQSK